MLCGSRIQYCNKVEVFVWVRNVTVFIASSVHHKLEEKYSNNGGRRHRAKRRRRVRRERQNRWR
jgi:hypothetical protein